MDITTIYKISKCRLINLICNLKFFQLLMGKELFIVENFKKKRYFFSNENINKNKQFKNCYIFLINIKKLLSRNFLVKT